MDKAKPDSERSDCRPEDSVRRAVSSRQRRIVPDDVLNEQTLGVVLEKVPLRVRNAMEKLGVGTALYRYRNRNKEDREKATVTVPLYYADGEGAGLVVDIFKEPRVPNKKDVAGVVCDIQKLRSLNADSCSVKTAFCVSEFSDLYNLEKTLPEDGDDGVFFFCVKFFRNFFYKYTQFGKSEKPGECDLILDLFRRHGIKMIVCGHSEKDRNAGSWHEAAVRAEIETVLLGPEDYHCQGQAADFSEYVVNGGNHHRLAYLASVKSKPEVAPSSPSRYAPAKKPTAMTGLGVLASVNRSLFSGAAPKRYVCADEGTLKYQLSPEPKTLTIIGGSKGEGKTALISEICVEAAMRNDDLSSVLIVNTDQTEETLVRRIMCQITGISYNAIRDNRLTADDEVVLKERADVIRSVLDRFHFLCGQSSTNSQSIEEAICESNPRILVIDHIQKIRIFEDRDDGIAEARLSSRERIEHVLDMLRHWISRRHLAVIVASAVSRGGYSVSGGAYGGELRDSSTLDYDATNVWKMKNVAKKPYNRLLINDKSKEYDFMDIPLLYEGEFMRFTEIETGGGTAASTGQKNVEADTDDQPHDEGPRFLIPETEDNDE